MPFAQAIKTTQQLSLYVVLIHSEQQEHPVAICKARPVQSEYKTVHYAQKQSNILQDLLHVLPGS